MVRLVGDVINHQRRSAALFSVMVTVEPGNAHSGSPANKTRSHYSGSAANRRCNERWSSSNVKVNGVPASSNTGSGNLTDLQQCWLWRTLRKEARKKVIVIKMENRSSFFILFSSQLLSLHSNFY